MEEYRKTYVPFIAWIMGFTGVSLVAPGVAGNYFELSSGDPLKITLGVMVIALDVLFLMVYLGEYVYWINGGPDFERAKKAGSAKRKAYALKHLKLVAKASVIALIYLVISGILQFNAGMDFVVVLGLILLSAIKTMGIKFED